MKRVRTISGCLLILLTLSIGSVLAGQTEPNPAAPPPPDTTSRITMPVKPQPRQISDNAPARLTWFETAEILLSRLMLF